VSQPTDEETIQYGIDSDDDEDVEFEKFEEDTREQYLLNFHPESKAVNFDEVKSLCTVIRDSDGDIIDDFHTTIPILTKYEKARILGLRAKQLNSNIKPMIPVPDYIIDSYRIAELELEAKAIPFIIKRPLPDGRNEYWRAQDLTCVY
jgi:DNA-directed RNA polymerase I, II, and III subunit RPABC2